MTGSLEELRRLVAKHPACSDSLIRQWAASDPGSVLAQEFARQYHAFRRAVRWVDMRLRGSDNAWRTMLNAVCADGLPWEQALPSTRAACEGILRLGSWGQTREGALWALEEVTTNWADAWCRGHAEGQWAVQASGYWKQLLEVPRWVREPDPRHPDLAEWKVGFQGALDHLSGFWVGIGLVVKRTPAA